MLLLAGCPLQGKIREFGKMGKIREFYKNMSGKYQGIFSYIYTDSFPIFQDIYNIYIYICQSRDCNLVESQILLVETPIGVSTSRVSDWDFYW